MFDQLNRMDEKQICCFFDCPPLVFNQPNLTAEDVQYWKEVPRIEDLKEDSYAGLNSPKSNK